MTFGAGERILSDWMNENAFVCWLEHSAPWEIEGQLILELRPPLNLAENSAHLLSGTLCSSQPGTRSAPDHCTLCRTVKPKAHDTRNSI